MTLTALSDTERAPLYRAEFRDLDPSRYPRPATIRYQPRETPAIGMFDTTRPPPLRSNGTGHIISDAAREQALENRANKVRPHSIATRAIAVMRERGDWISTGELVELANRHTPEGCVQASRANIYEALSVWRKKGVIESSQEGDITKTLKWRITQ